MHIVIFAGGAGTRLWPLSRNHSPKQFEFLKDDKSTLQMAVERIASFGFENIYISTNEKYSDLVRGQVRELPQDHLFVEPAKRDLAAAIGLTLLRLKERGITGTISVLWADHFMDNPEEFVQALKDAEKMVEEKKDRLIFLGEKARFANHNLGWIKIGKQINQNVYEFLEWRYKPDIDACKKMFSSHEWVWNPGYFVFDIDFLISLYKEFQPEMLQALEKMVQDESLVTEQYKDLEAISFDKAILEKVPSEQAVVMKVNLGWSDPGTLYALKEALTSSTEENFTKGESVLYETEDSFIYNEEPEKLVTAVGLEGVIVINTKDSLLVCHKDAVPHITDLLEELKKAGKEHYL